jgi:hypothetical protein
MPAGPRQCSHSQVWVPRHSWPHFTVSDSRLPQPGGSGPHIYIPQEQGGSVIPQGTPPPPPTTRRATAEVFDPAPSPVFTSSRLKILGKDHRRKHRFQQFLSCCVLNRCCGDVAKIVSVGKSFVSEARYPVMALVYLLISRSLPSNSSTHHNMHWSTTLKEWSICDLYAF